MRPTPNDRATCSAAPILSASC